VAITIAVLADHNQEALSRATASPSHRQIAIKVAARLIGVGSAQAAAGGDIRSQGHDSVFLTIHTIGPGRVVAGKGVEQRLGCIIAAGGEVTLCIQQV